MDIKQAPSTALQAALEEQNRQPLLDESEKLSEKSQKTSTQKAIRKSFKISSHLAKLLPTSTVFTFQTLSPFLTHQGTCKTYESKRITLAFIVLSAFSCFFVCFTDSVRDEKGKVHHVLATYNGFWAMDGLATVTPEEAAKYRIKFMDFIHGILSIIVFVAVVFFNQNIVKCFYPSVSDQAQDFLHFMPIVVGAICSLLFVAFPTNRHGIGFPLSRN